MSFFERFNDWVRQSLMLKLAAIGVLVLLLLIPTAMVQSLIQERSYNSQSVVSEVSEAWSHPQRLSGPMLTIPYLEYFKSDDDELKSLVRYANFLPKKLNVNGDLDAQTRYRSIYEVIVYNSKLSFAGSFERPNFSEWKVKEEDILWDEAYISVGISDMRGIQNAVKLDWNGAKHSFQPGLEYAKDIGRHDASGIGTRIDLSKVEENYAFQFSLDLNGSRELYFTPLGEDTNVRLHSNWATPSFQGAFLPDARTISDTSSTAEWHILNLNRNYPQRWLGNSYTFGESQFGLELLVPVDYYQKSTRSAKYGILFIALTFLTFFFIEVLNGKRIHPIQYILVGLALVLFYTLLLSFSEHIGFTWAYISSSIATIGLIGIYVSSIFKNSKLSFALIGILIILYGFIFTLLQLQDFALLLGSVGLFLILAVVMLFTRRIDWYAIRGNKE